MREQPHNQRQVAEHYEKKLSYRLSRLNLNPRPNIVKQVHKGEYIVERQRYLLCEHYDYCLGYAVAMKWTNFHCHACWKCPDHMRKQYANLIDEGIEEEEE